MIRPLLSRLRSLWKGVRDPHELDAEMAEEFRAHQELRAAELVRSGLTPEEAARRARLEFGDVERYKDQGRASRGLRPFDEIRFSWLDLKLSFRMLVKYPGITIVGGLAMAFAVWAGAGTFEIVTQVLYPRLPFDEGDRIVGVGLWQRGGGEEEQALHELVTWREELTSLEELGAYRDLQRNLIVGTGLGEPTALAEISAAAFRVTRVPALLGRTLIEADELPDSPPVVLIGYDIWQSRFGGDPDVVGRVVGLGATRATVVGVMPEGYGFPVAHNVWTPLKVSAYAYDRRTGPEIRMFGKLAPGVSMDQAQAELTLRGQAEAEASPETHELITPRVAPYAASALNMPPDLRTEISLAALSSNLVPLTLLLLICANVALLMFARAAARESELVVRSALGASRKRIIVQLFAEALVLGAVAAAVGLAAASFGIRWVFSVATENFLGGGRLPFWFTATLSPATVFYTAVLTILCAILAGVLPALKVTSGEGARLKAATAGGGGLRLGGVWTAVIISQVAVTVVFPVIAVYTQRDAARETSPNLGFASSEFVSVRVEMDREPPPHTPADTSAAAFQARYERAFRELELSLRSDPAVVDLTYARRVPRMYHPWNQVEVDQGAVAPQDERGHRVGSAPVDIDYFDVLGTPVLSGRGFQESDLVSDARVVIVNSSFVQDVLGGKNPLGRHVRFVADESSREPSFDGPWYEIVGVAPDLGEMSGYGKAGVYRPAEPGSAYPAHMVLHVGGDPGSFGSTLREAAMRVDPSLRLHDPIALDDLAEGEVQFYRFWFLLSAGVSALALLLSLASIYAVMSFTVSRRTREVGIRLAMGAQSRQVARAIFARPVTEVAIGIALGTALIVIVEAFGPDGDPLANRIQEAGVVLAYAALMMAVCMLACVVPTRRALSIQPTDALRSEG